MDPQRFQRVLDDLVRFAIRLQEQAGLDVVSDGEWRSEMDPTQDLGWQRQITLRFAPHPELMGGTRKAIELDYGMTDGEALITTRVCLSYYLERQFGLDADAPKSKGERLQIVLVNRDEVEAARREVGEACGVDPPRSRRTKIESLRGRETHCTVFARKPWKS
jgi:hypothetical protein